MICKSQLMNTSHDSRISTSVLPTQLGFPAFASKPDIEETPFARELVKKTNHI